MHVIEIHSQTTATLREGAVGIYELNLVPQKSLLHVFKNQQLLQMS